MFSKNAWKIFRPSNLKVKLNSPSTCFGLQNFTRSSHLPSKNSFSTFRIPQDEKLLLGIIGANVAVFGMWSWSSTRGFQTQQFMRDHFTLSADGVLRKLRFHTMATSMFSHADFGHLLFNMITLYFFGREAIMVLGAKSFLKLYTFGGLASSACHLAWSTLGPLTNVPGSFMIGPYQKSLGASGAVNAVILWSTLMFPTRTVLIYFVLPVPAALLGLMFVGKDLYGLYNGSSGIANAAHLGGAAYGTLFYLMARRRFF